MTGPLEAAVENALAFEALIETLVTTARQREPESRAHELLAMRNVIGGYCIASLTGNLARRPV